MYIGTTPTEDTYLFYYVSIKITISNIYPLCPLELLLHILFNLAILLWGVYPIDIFNTCKMTCVQENLF